MGYERALFGFAGGGGTLEKGVVRYSVAPRLLQPTTLGELDGTTTPRLERIANEFRRAGFPVALESRMDAWQTTHEAWVSPVANAIYAVGGDNRRLLTSHEVVVLMLHAIRGTSPSSVLSTFRSLRRSCAHSIACPSRCSSRFSSACSPPAASRSLLPGMRTQLATRWRRSWAELSALAAAAGTPTPAADELARYVDASGTPLLD